MNNSIFESGSCWLKADFHLHTNADKEFKYNLAENDYINNYIQALNEAGIKLGVIANHNKFDKEEFKKLRRKANKHGIGLLPGVELSLKEGHSGIHVIIVFSNDWFDNSSQTNHIESFLNSAFAGITNYKHKNSNSNDDLNQIVKKLDHYGCDYFLIFAHVEQNKGLFKELGPGLIKELFQNDIVSPRILGFQKVRTSDLRTKIQQELGNYYPAEVEGCDAKNLDDLSNLKSVSSYLKLGNFDFKSVKFALRNHKTRVSNDCRKYDHSYIKKITFQGAGSLGNSEINLSPELNTLIGIRGSGKSSILEGIRYVLDIPYSEHATDTSYKNELIHYMLQSGGIITLDAIDKQGQPFQIRRILGEKPEVFRNGIKQPSGISIRETVVYNPIYFGQNDLSNTKKGFEKDLIEKLTGEALVPARLEIDEAKQRIISIIENLQLSEQFSVQNQEIEQKKNDVKARLEIYQKYDFDTVLQKQIDFDRDERKFEQVLQVSKEYLSGLNNTLDQHHDELINQFPYKSELNKSSLEDLFKNYKKLLNGFNKIKEIVNEGQISVEEMQQNYSEFLFQKQNLKFEFAEIERNFAYELKQENISGISSEEFRGLKASLENFERILKHSNITEQKTNEVKQKLTEELVVLNSLWKEEFEIIQKVIGNFNNDDSKLKLEVGFQSDKKAMFGYLQQIFQGSRMQKPTLRKVVNNYNDFGSVWLNKETVRSILGNSFEKFWVRFEENLKDFITWQVPNEFTIKYHERELAKHSSGQKASAMLLFILNQKDNDLVIIDQPEDDLDNQTIYSDVIKLIRKLKPKTQFIFATHNANFPVLGDAEMVISCDYSNNQIHTQNGSIDCSEVQKSIVNVMEGGAEAFQIRKEVYEDWNPKS
ncbi:MAG: AAA family ATPase [Chloroflexi bacterium]|nr:AAA family ATPase [Chloroflexota bacterium]